MRRLTEHEFERLDTFFLRLEDDDAMLLSTLDGLLAGVVVCPETIVPSEWLPTVWGGEGPVFENEQETKEILGLVMIRCNEIAHDLGREGKFEPILDIDNDGTALWEIWIEGFVAAMALRPESWKAYDEAEEEEVRGAFQDLLGLIGLAERVDEVSIRRMEEIGRHADEIIAGCLEILNAARLKRQPAPPKTAASIRVGRNDPCPCGSGKKFKKCCMS